MGAAEDWAEALASWAIPPEIMARAPEDPWAWPVGAFVRATERAVDSDPANDRYWGNVGSALYNLKRYPEATRYYEEAVHRGSKRAEVYYYLAQSLIRQDRWQEARTAAQNAVNLGGERLNYLFALGLTHAGSGDLEGARKIWDHILQRWPEDARTRQAYEYYLGH